MGDPEQAGFSDLLDLLGHPRGPLALDVLTPQSPEALDEPARRVDLQVLALDDRRSVADALVAGACVQSEVTTAPKVYLRRISVSVIAFQRRSGVVLM